MRDGCLYQHQVDKGQGERTGQHMQNLISTVIDEQAEDACRLEPKGNMVGSGVFQSPDMGTTTIGV